VDNVVVSPGYHARVGSLVSFWCNTGGKDSTVQRGIADLLNREYAHRLQQEALRRGIAA
jgi:hypothetical protein